jgi:hypothetical protein
MGRVSLDAEIDVAFANATRTGVHLSTQQEISKCPHLAPLQLTCNAAILLGKPHTIICVSHGRPRIVLCAPCVRIPLCCFFLRTGSGLDPIYVLLDDTVAYDRSK